MLEWILIGILFILTYVVLTLTTTSGSQYADNSIDAFISKGSPAVKGRQPRETKYKKDYTTEGQQILVLYGTEYGFSEEVARKLFDRLSTESLLRGTLWQPRLVNVKHYQHIHWSEEQLCLLVISTSGDGVPPTDALPFYEMLMKSCEDFSHLHYAVLALGDSNYPQFCKTGKTLDKRFCELLAVRDLDCQTVDMEDWEVISDWMNRVMGVVSDADLKVRKDYLSVSSLGGDEGHNRTNPFFSKLMVKRLLTYVEHDDDKATIHCEFDIAGSGLTWISGDALGIYPQNNPYNVQRILQTLGYSGLEKIDIQNHSLPVNIEGTITSKEMLLKYLDIKHVRPEFLENIMDFTRCPLQRRALEDLIHPQLASNIREYLLQREIIDILEEFKVDGLPVEKFLSLLKPLQPRYYSISSSPQSDSNTVCVTAAVVRYASLDKCREGVTTCYLQNRLQLGDQCPVFISRNPDFRLPSNTKTPLILIGPGTGIAPFRAFLQERALISEEDRGMTLLYFGCRHKNKDFLYREELEKWQENFGLHLRIAFSRDQREKIYVQDLLLEDSVLVWSLISKENAAVYVCGDAKHMSHDVHKTLLEIIITQGQITPEEAKLYLSLLEREGRYQIDVWVT
ncbi:NADPH oxidoreductase A-like [Saccostrea echinata]|uniref:NADPH oxidoreductase A-like n=1 Tax=Saccostrea echinata TaxID=191078 RepID=UPI002A821272|nr:NADPH oxidoreductase A-like [Saccostrea echinata]